MKAVGKTPTDRLANAKVVIAREFGWERIDTRSQQEFYSKDSYGRVHWLKARTEVPGRESTSWDSIKSTRPYAMLVGILVAPSVTSEADITLVVRASKETVEDLKSNKGSDNPRFRWHDETKVVVEYLYSR